MIASATDTTPAPIPVDPAELARFLDGDYAEVRRRVREVLCDPDFVPPVEPTRAEYREQVLKWTRALASTGETTMGFPEEFGGGGDIGASVVAFETLGLGDLSLLVKVGVQFGLFGGAVLQLGTREHHERYLGAIGSVELPGCFAMTETGHGSDVQEIGTTATYDPDAQEFVIHTPDRESYKDYIGNAAAHGRMAAVFAQLSVKGESHGVHCLLVPIRDKRGKTLDGVTVQDDGPKIGLNGVDNGRLAFDQVRVPRENLLNRFATVSADGVYESSIESVNKRFFTMLGTLIQGRVCVCAASISATKMALTIATRYACRRKQFGPPDGSGEVSLMSYLTHQRRLLPAIAKTYALHFAQEEMTARLHESFSGEQDEHGRLRRELESLAAGMKAVATWHATETIQTCREACGGAGYLSENQFAALRADTDVFTTFEGDNTVLLQLVAKSLLTDFSDHFGDLDPIGMAGFVVTQLLQSVVERSAVRQVVGAIADVVPGGAPDDEALLGHGDQLELVQRREQHMVSSVARRMKTGIDRGYDAFEVLLTCQDHLVSAARAHLDRVLLEAFDRAIVRCEDDAIAQLLNHVRDLFALRAIESERGWYLEHGRISSARSKNVTKTINRLCGELAGEAETLVTGFGIPDGLVRAPIAAG